MPYLPVVRPANTPIWTRDLDLPPKGWELRTLNEYLDGKPPRHAGLPPFGRTVAMWRTHFQHLVQEARYAESPTRFLLGSLHGWHDGYTGAELEFPRQGYSNANLPVGTLLAWPSLVTHPHRSTPLLSGTKYSLTLWFELPLQLN